jgi:adenine phosphoribosyltransferase
MAESLSGHRFDLLVGIESRGFIFAAALAYALGKGKVPVRKPGKLPAKTVQVSYELEYGTDRLEIHEDAIGRGQAVVIVDDVLATGGTARGTANLVEKVGGEVVALSFFIELEFLKGREKLSGFDVRSVLSYR